MAKNQGQGQIGKNVQHWSCATQFIVSDHGSRTRYMSNHVSVRALAVAVFGNRARYTQYWLHFDFTFYFELINCKFGYDSYFNFSRVTTF